MGKKEALRQFHQKVIADVADELFQARGVEKTTMDDIARVADYSKATLYVYFKNKDDIFHYIVVKAMGMLLEAVDEAIKTGDDAIVQYHAICNAVAVFSRQHPFYYQSTMKTISVEIEDRRANPVLEEIYALGEQINSRIEQVMHCGVGQGYFREDAAQVQTVFLYWASISSVVQLADSKEAYIHQRMGLTKSQFLQYSFDTLLRAISK